MTPRVEDALMGLCAAAAPLVDWTNITGRIGRRAFWFAMLSAAGMVTIGYAMDLFLFGPVEHIRPDFFACAIGAILSLPVLTLGVRRLRDAGGSVWLMLLLFIPVAGWLLLARCWCEPSGMCATPARSAPRPQLEN